MRRRNHLLRALLLVDEHEGVVDDREEDVHQHEDDEDREEAEEQAGRQGETLSPRHVESARRKNTLPARKADQHQPRHRRRVVGSGRGRGRDGPRWERQLRG